MPASNDKEEEEVLLETQNIQDYKHLTEVGEVMGKDNNTIMLYQQFMNLIMPN